MELHTAVSAAFKTNSNMLFHTVYFQVNYILESRASTSRADYFAQKQRKLSRRTSFSFQKEKKSGQ